MSVCNVCYRGEAPGGGVPLASAAGRRRTLCRFPSLPSAGRRSLWIGRVRYRHAGRRPSHPTPAGGVPVARVPEKAYMFEMSLTQ